MVNKTNEIIVRLYEERVLDEELGEGKLKQRLIKGLENILEKINPPVAIIIKETPLLEERINAVDFLNKPIDYQAIFKITKKYSTQPVTTAKKIKRVLSTSGFLTYGDITDRFGKSKYRDMHSFLSSHSGIGLKSLRILLDHLKLEGFKNLDYNPNNIIF